MIAHRISHGIDAAIVAILILDGLQVPVDGQPGDVLFDVLTFAACWLLGFAHHDGMLDRIPKRFCFAIAGARGRGRRGVGRPAPAEPWHNIAIALAIPLAAYFGAELDWEWFLVSIVLTTAFVLALGWVEDLSARRRPLIPGRKTRRSPGQDREPGSSSPAESTVPPSRGTASARSRPSHS